MASPFQPKQVQVNGVDLAYIERGTGDPVVFVHGSLGDYRTWMLQLEPFARRYHVIAYSRRYHWPNALPGQGVPYAAAQHATDLAALIEALGIAPTHVVGSSYGAMTALTCAVGRPDLIRSLTLGEPPLLPWLAQSPGGTAILETFLATAFQPAGQALAAGQDEVGIGLFLDGVLGPGAYTRLPAEVRAGMLDNAAAMRFETTTAPDVYFSALAPEDVNRLRLPTLLVQGEVSPLMFGMITDELARYLPHAERATIPRASHSMHTMNPQAYNETVLAFLDRH